MARDGGLGQAEDVLKIGYEERRGRQAVEDPEPGGLRDREEDLGGRGGAHMRENIYTPWRMNKPRGRPGILDHSRHARIRVPMHP